MKTTNRKPLVMAHRYDDGRVSEWYNRQQAAERRARLVRGVVMETSPGIVWRVDYHAAANA